VSLLQHMIYGKWAEEPIGRAAPNRYQHSIHAGRFIGSVCLSCGRAIGFSPSMRVISVLEEAHDCPAKKRVKSASVRSTR
jgi:hypothetical protein